MSRIDHLADLARYQAEFLAAIPLADPGAPVPWCGRWRVRTLVVHLARIHHWAAAQARRSKEVPLGRGPFELEALYSQCATELLDTLTELDPDARAWTLLDDGVPRAERTGTVRFWHRRQALETLVHTWDLFGTMGRDFDPGPEAWADCVDEVVGVMHPRQIRLGRIPPPMVRVRLQAEDIALTWELAGSEGSRQALTVSGPAQTLALLAWGRTTVEDPALSLEGDRAALQEVLVRGLTP